MKEKIKKLVLILCIAIPVANAENNNYAMHNSNRENGSELILMPNASIKYSVKVFEKKIHNTDSQISASGVYNNSSPLIANIQYDFNLKFFWTKFSHGNIIERFPPTENESCNFNIMKNNFIVALRKTDHNTYEYSLNEISIGHNNFLSNSFSKNISYRATSKVSEKQSIRIDVRDSNYQRVYLITPENI